MRYIVSLNERRKKRRGRRTLPIQKECLPKQPMVKKDKTSITGNGYDCVGI